MLESSRSFIENINSAGKQTDPQALLRVLSEPDYVVIRNRCRIKRIVVICNEGMPVESVQAVLRSDPEKSLFVLKHAQRAVLRQSVRGAEVLETQ